MQAINDIVKMKSGASLENIREDEYVKDNLIYCKKCNTPRSLYINSPFGNGEKLVRCICDCQEKEYYEEKRRERENERIKEIEKLKVASLIGDRYKNVSFETTDQTDNNSFNTAFIRCKRYCEASNKVYQEGMGIYLFGDKGTGKTHLTACMANALMNKHYQVLFTNFFEISKMIRSTFNSNNNESENDYINRLANIDFLFIDDLGTERVNNGEADLWLQEKMFDVLNKRYNMKKPTIFSSNYSLTELIKERGIADKTIDRIAEMSTAILKIEGESYRLKNRVKKDLPF